LKELPNAAGFELWPKPPKLLVAAPEKPVAGLMNAEVPIEAV